MLIICDFDGTVTARDTNSHLARTFAPGAFDAVEGKLATREMSLRDVLAAEYAGITAGHDEVVGLALEIPFREGFGRLLDAAQRNRAEVVLLSSGFRQLIEPMLARNGHDGRVPLIANDIELGPSGGRITWRELPHCELCGEQCKRHDVERLRQGAAHDGRQFERVVFVGDGYSDRCGAEAADEIFARDSLAGWLDRVGHPWRAWNDFDDVTRALDLR